MSINAIDNSVIPGTAISAGIGAVGAGAYAYYTQRSLLKNAAPADKLVKTAVSKPKRFFNSIKNWFSGMNKETVSQILKNKKTDWKTIGMSGLKGAGVVGGAYLLYQGAKALINKD